MTQRKNPKGHSKKEGKTSALESKNGKKTERGGGQEGSKRSVLTWFLVLALLGVWSSMAVVYFDIVDYDSVIGKLVTYDADGDGDFDMEDAKVLLDENTLGGSSLRADGLRKDLPARGPLLRSLLRQELRMIQEKMEAKRIARIAFREIRATLEEEEAEREVAWVEKMKTLEAAQDHLRREKQKIEEDRLANERIEKERLEKERLEQERVEKERLEQERVEKERLEQERVEKERLEQERVEKERLEQERVEKERLEQERVEKERLAKERAEQERLAKERAEKERLAKERAEQERLAKERAEQERLAKERAEKEKLAKERAEKERLAKERAEQEKLAKERAEKERLAKERAEKERLAKERAEKERLAKERAEQERLPREEVIAERVMRKEKNENASVEKVTVAREKERMERDTRKHFSVEKPRIIPEEKAILREKKEEDIMAAKGGKMSTEKQQMEVAEERMEKQSGSRNKNVQGRMETKRMERVKVEREASSSVTVEHLGEASSNQGPGSRGAEPIEATSPALPVEDGSPGVQDLEAEIQDQDFVPDDPQSSLHPHEDPAEGIDRTGALVEEPSVEDSEVDSGQYLTSSKFTQEAAETRSEPPESKSEREAEPGPHGTTDRQAEEKPKEKAPAKAKKPKLLNKFDKTIKAEIDAAEKLRKKGKLEEALRAFDALVQLHPQSPRARYGKAQAEDGLAEKLRSNDMLQKAISTYREAAELPDATADLLRAALKRRAERQQFLGRMRGALATLEKLTQVFPDDIGLKNDLGVAHLLLGDNKGAKRVYEEVLAVAPTDGFAKVHYGFILKSENKIAESIPYLKEGLESGEPGTDDGRFYFHLGDALQRVGDESAYHWYEVGHKHGHFASVWQRSLYNVNGLKAQPWWTPKETGYTDLVKALERNWKTIRDEALAGMDQKSGLFIPEEENLREKGEWGQYTLWQQGKKLATSCQSVPKTCSLLERFPEATGCKRGQIKFSVMQPGTHVWPHTGPTNCRLRMHLGLVVPKHGCRIRCTDQTREWQEGKVLIFDDSFEHEVWQEADSYRLIFIVDVWHPELTASQRQGLSPI
eukprot:XP_011617521.1 PREDICTED: aspartyl/asparaginyl beta-hydroxylase-like [Takifugu rubripes]